MAKGKSLLQLAKEDPPKKSSYKWEDSLEPAVRQEIMGLLTLIKRGELAGDWSHRSTARFLKEKAGIKVASSTIGEVLLRIKA